MIPELLNGEQHRLIRQTAMFLKKKKIPGKSYLNLKEFAFFRGHVQQRQKYGESISGAAGTFLAGGLQTKTLGQIPLPLNTEQETLESHLAWPHLRRALMQSLGPGSPCVSKASHREENELSGGHVHRSHTAPPAARLAR